MKKTKVLLVSGMDDYGVLQFEDYNQELEYSLQDWVERLEKTEKKREYIEEEEWSFSVELFEFGEIDPNFLVFIQDNIQDYDDSKHTDFFVVREEE